MRSPRAASTFAVLWAFPLLLGCPGGSQVAPPPVLESVEPRVTAWNVPMHLVITGRNFGGEALTRERAPTLTVIRMRDLDGNPVAGPSDGGPVPVTVSGGVERIDVWVALNNAAPPGLYGFRVTRQDGASGDFPDALALVPPLSANGLDAAAICATAPSPIVAITGADFLVAGGVGPKVTLSDGAWVSSPGAFSATLDATPLGCRRVPFDRADLRLCTRLEAPLPLAAPSRVYDLAIAQPPPADQLAAGALALLVDRPIWPTSFSPPVRSALDAPLDLVIGGGPPPSPQSWGIHVPTGGAPTAVVEGVSLAVGASGCQSGVVPGHDWCSTLTMTVPQGFSTGPHSISVTTMPGCTGQASFELTPRPSITAVTPPVACLRAQTRLGIDGSGFIDPTVLLGGHQLTLVLTCPPGSGGCGQIAAVLFPFPYPPGIYSLTVVNGSLPPAATGETVPVTVAPGPPTLMTPTPQTIYGGVSRTVSVGFTEPATTITSVALMPWGVGALTPVPFTQGAQGIDITVPAGTPPGWYDVRVTEGGQCTGGAWQPVMVVSDFRVLFDDFATGLGNIGLEVNWKDWKEVMDPLVLPVWQPSGGNPGGAASHAFAAADPTWWFSFPTYGWAGFDLSALYFDLRPVASSGAAVAAPDVRLRGIQSELHLTLPTAPGPAWQSYAVRLDDPAGWTVVDATGSRPATAADLRHGIDAAFAVWIRGLYADGGGETWIDNLAVELHH